MVKKGQPLINARKPRPQVWRSGPDPIDHKIYKTWATSRAQAHFRDEEWDLAWEDYRDIWKPYWDRRGRDGQDLCLSRKNPSEPWGVSNVELITRAQNAQRHNATRLQRNNDARAAGTFVKRINGKRVHIPGRAI